MCYSRQYFEYLFWGKHRLLKKMSHLHLSSSPGVLMGTLATLSSLETTASPASVMGTLTCVSRAPVTPRLASASSVRATQPAGTANAARRTTTGTPAGQSGLGSLLTLYTHAKVNQKTMMCLIEEEGFFLFLFFFFSSQVMECLFSFVICLCFHRRVLLAPVLREWHYLS